MLSSPGAAFASHQGSAIDDISDIKRDENRGQNT